MEGLIQVPASVVDFRPKADRSYKLTFETRELGGKDVALLADSYRGEGWLLFKPNGEVAMEEVPEGVADASVKSPSQRLRSVLYLVWKGKGARGSFENYYNTAIEKMIEIAKEQIEEA